MELKIRLLGAMELVVDGHVVTPGASKRRAVLAGLALHSNRPVSLARLAQMSWADAPPASAIANLRSHASALRRLLGDRLIARRNAYELSLSPGELDVTEFERLAAKGRAALASADLSGAITDLGAALALWRGAAGEGLPNGTTLDSAWSSLEEQRLGVFEELSEARLAAGQHDQLLPALRGHLAAHPLRERAWAQLMLALYRCGDVAAALAVFRDARAVLNDQLGIEPGEALVTLHRDILDRAPHLALDSTAGISVVGPNPATAGRRHLPRELPPAPATLVGRGREAAEVIAALRGRTPAAVVISGTAGSGKTALVVHAAHTVAADFPDGQVFVDLGYQRSYRGDDVLARVLRALGENGDDVPDQGAERAGRLRSLLADRRVLIVLDGVTHAAQARPLLPASPGSVLIVVTQRHLRSLDGVHRVKLNPLSVKDGRALLDALGCAERLAAASSDAAELVRLCGGSPLALRIAASRLASRPSATVASLVAELRDARRRLDLLAADDLSVRQRIDLGYAAVRAEDDLVGPVFALLGSAPGAAVPPDETAARLGVPTARVWQALEKLLDAHLVCLDPSSGGYRLPPLVRDYAAELAELSAMPVLHPLPTWRVESVVDPLPAPMPSSVSPR